MDQVATLDPALRSRIVASFGRQKIISLLNARLVDLAPGLAVIEFDFQEHLTQQNGYIHAGILTTAIDSACGYAAFTLMPAGSSVLSIEFKINFLSPALGDKFICTGRVVRAGQTVTVCSGEVMAATGGEQKLVALMQATMMRVDARND